jgi:putative transposase
VRYTTRLAESQIVASVGSRGDSYDNALAESTIGLYKTELINQREPWRDLDHTTFATLEYVDWYNHRRLHGGITPDNTYTTPAEHETAYHQNNPTKPLVTQTTDSL